MAGVKLFGTTNYGQIIPLKELLAMMGRLLLRSTDWRRGAMLCWGRYRAGYEWFDLWQVWDLGNREQSYRAAGKFDRDM